MPIEQASLSRPELHRAVGSFVAAAVGDALGAPFEFGSPGQYSLTYPAPVLTGVGEMTGNHLWDEGEFTDDTQMALCLAESLLACREFDVDDVWARWCDWATDAKDVGITTRRSLSYTSPAEAAANAQATGSRSAANGALMRAFPIALWAIDWHIKDAMALAVHQGSLTHHDPAAGWGAAIAVELIRRGIRGHALLDDLDLEIADVLSHVPQPERDQFAAVLSPHFDPHMHNGPSNSTVWTCLAHAVWSLRNGTSLPHTLQLAIDLGGDTDTVACVAGALAGSVYGIQAIPSRWLAHVNGEIKLPALDIGEWYDAARLQDVARQLLGFPPARLTPPEPASGPGPVDDNLYAANLDGAARAPQDWAVMSFCRTENRFKNHVHRRESYLIDEEGNHNLDIESVVRDAVDSIDAFLAEGIPVVVHCHGGRSRTGLVLKAWAMRKYKFTEREAHNWLAQSWPLYADYNRSFITFLRDDWNQ